MQWTVPNLLTVHQAACRAWRGRDVSVFRPALGRLVRNAAVRWRGGH